MTALTCDRCRRPISDCQCPDIDARLRAVAHDPAAREVMFKWCRRCDTHYARCHCGTPAFFIICAGEDITAEATRGMPTLAGDITIPDLRRP